MKFRYFILESTDNTTKIERDLCIKEMERTFQAEDIVKDEVVSATALSDILPSDIFSVSSEYNTVTFNGIGELNKLTYKIRLRECGAEMTNDFLTNRHNKIWNLIEKLKFLPFGGVYVLNGVAFYPIELVEVLGSDYEAGKTFFIKETGMLSR